MSGARQGGEMAGGDGKMEAVALPVSVITVQAAFGIVAHDLADYFECLGEEVIVVRARVGLTGIWLIGHGDCSPLVGAPLVRGGTGGAPDWFTTSSHASGFA